MLQALKEKRFAKRIIKRHLRAHRAVSSENPQLSGSELYKEILLHIDKPELSEVHKILRQAEDSVDVWTTGAVTGLGFRQVVHFIVMSQYEAEGHSGSIVSFREIVYSNIPENM
jgi:hypothetical protein